MRKRELKGVPIWTTLEVHREPSLSPRGGSSEVQRGPGGTPRARIGAVPSGGTSPATTSTISAIPPLNLNLGASTSGATSPATTATTTNNNDNVLVNGGIALLSNRGGNEQSVGRELSANTRGVCGPTTQLA